VSADEIFVFVLIGVSLVIVAFAAIRSRRQQRASAGAAAPTDAGSVQADSPEAGPGRRTFKDIGTG
jgi:hypothetical protein